jgi:hypothetical protein
MMSRSLALNRLFDEPVRRTMSVMSSRTAAVKEFP